ncbi:MAG: helix-turn-helix transcriptional regulator [Eubacteriales bacterium]|nr:helix-turn-helix transcriptional regulator [Eubacteriales bacterium]
MEKNLKKFIQHVCIDKDISVSELARRLATTPQNFNQKLGRESLTWKDLQQIADALDCRLDVNFEPNEKSSDAQSEE